MAGQGQVGQGDIPITLDGEERIMHPSFNAAQTLSRQAGGIMGCIERVMKLDMDMIVQVVSLGLGYGTNQNRAPKELAEKIWRSGLTDDSPGAITERCVRYLRTLASGGRPPRDEENSGGENDERDPQNS